jgi:hypothetical protein
METVARGTGEPAGPLRARRHGQPAGLDQVLAGLGNTASLTQESFSAVTQGVQASVAALVDGGASQEQMLQIMAPTLQKVWEGWQY